MGRIEKLKRQAINEANIRVLNEQNQFELLSKIGEWTPQNLGRTYVGGELIVYFKATDERDVESLTLIVSEVDGNVMVGKDKSGKEYKILNDTGQRWCNAYGEEKCYGEIIKITGKPTNIGKQQIQKNPFFTSRKEQRQYEKGKITRDQLKMARVSELDKIEIKPIVVYEKK